MLLTAMNKQGKQNWIIFTSMILHMYIQQVDMMSSVCITAEELNRRIANLTRVHAEVLQREIKEDGNLRIANLTKLHVEDLQREIKEEMDRFYPEGPCADSPCNSGVCVNDTSSDRGYRCECPEVLCSCFQHDEHCSYVADDCTGQARDSWHLYRDNAWCNTYYQCGREGDGITRPNQACLGDRVYNLTAGACSYESTCFVAPTPDPHVDPCLSDPCINGGDCVSYNETDEEPRYECVCPSTPCSCADQGINCQNSDDACIAGAADFSYHFNRTDPECKAYYRCNNVGAITSTEVCPMGEMINAATQLCASNSQFECYIPPTIDPDEDPCESDPCLNGGSCISINQTNQEPRYECVCPSTPCSCADQGMNCEYSEDDCGNGAEHFSYHLNRTDTECRLYYRCNNAGSVISPASCTEGEIFDTTSLACVPNDLFVCYVEPPKTCADSPCNSGVCVNDTSSDKGYRCECPVEECSCFQYDDQCSYVADDCTGMPRHSFHVYRDDPECATYYQCSSEGAGILHANLQCKLGEVYDGGCTSDTSCLGD